MNYLPIVLLILASHTLTAKNHQCLAWKELSNVTCIFAGDTAKIWVRECENPCWQNQYGSNWSIDCDQERICHPQNPNSFLGICSNWVQVSGVICKNQDSEYWAQQWQRACTVGTTEVWCSENKPHF